MVFSTKGIVLEKFRYSDSKIIAKIYTQKFGLQSYLIFGAESKAGRLISTLLQPLFLVDMQVYHSEKRSLQKIKEISNRLPFVSIPFDIQKRTVSLFLSEFLTSVLEENGVDSVLFDFIDASIKVFDGQNKHFQNSHLFFLLEMCKYLGIQPENNFSSSKSTFDLEAGKFIIGVPVHRYYANQHMSLLISKLLNRTHSLKENLFLSSAERRQLLDTIINYYILHLGQPRQLKTLKVLRQMF